MPLGEIATVPDFFSEDPQWLRLIKGRARANEMKPLRVIKFGGTSLGDASSIGKVVEIIRAAYREGEVVVVVSAMSGVTNKLIEAAARSVAGDATRVATIFEELRRQHDAAVSALVRSPSERGRFHRKMQERLEEGDRLCRETTRLRELTLPARDSISSIGERLSAPLVAAALAELGVASQAVEAIELVVTNSCHGSAEPRMDLTRERCQQRLGPLLRKGIVPVVTGFIGATVEGVLTTLGRGGSDYSATILGSALDADEIIIWKDVDGVLTADPRFVPSARTIPETSYHEATGLARFGAKVLHPRTLWPVIGSGIPVWIRNTFAPERPGTKITPEGSRHGAAKALPSTIDIAMVTISDPGLASIQDVLDRILANTAASGPALLLVAQRCDQNHTRLIVSAELVDHVVEVLRREFARRNTNKALSFITVNREVALVTAVGQDLQEASAMMRRTLNALAQEQTEILAITQNSSPSTISFVVARDALNAVLATAHHEFHLDRQY